VLQKRLGPGGLTTTNGKESRMSLISTLRSPPTNGAGKPAAPPPPPAMFAPKPPPGPHQLGSVSLQNVDALTSMSADEIEQTADRLVEAAHETADVLREAARRVRHSGMVANERLANFVRVATTCADAARMMAESVDRRDEAPAEPLPENAMQAQPETAAPAPAREPANLDRLAADLAATAAPGERADAH
jgi:hypothetical protein